MPKPFKFNYEQYRPKVVSVDMLDKLMRWVMRETTGITKLDAILGFFKLIAAFCYLWARKELVNFEFEIQKQKYEQKQTVDNQDEIDNEDLDGK